MQMRFKSGYFSVFSQRSVGMQFLIFLIASYADINAVALSIEDGIFKLWLVANRMKAEANFQMRFSISAIGMQMHRVRYYIAACR